MKKKERHEIILNEVHLHNRVLLSDLTNILNVSMDTVRRDLVELDKEKHPSPRSKLKSRSSTFGPGRNYRLDFDDPR